MRANPRIRSERGVALIMAMMVLLGLSLLSLVLMLTVAAERKISATSLRHQQALNIAEAGVNEALAQINNGLSPSTSNPRWVGQIFLANPGSVPVLGTDSVAAPTRQPAGSWLTYSTETKGPDALTIEYRTDAHKQVIYRYDQSANPAIQTASGVPIYKVTSTGRVGSAKARVVAEVIQKPTIATVQGAVMTGVPITFGGNCAVCGNNHSADTPVDGTHGQPGCSTYETNNGNLPAAWSTSTIQGQGSYSLSGVGNPPTSQSNPRFFAGPWEPLSMTQADFWSWVGAPVRNEPNPPTGVIYLDNNATAQDAQGNFAYHGGDGHGLLYVDGKLTVNGNFTYRGLIYVEGDLQINGTCWILGALVVKGKTTINIANGNLTVLYSSDAITQNINSGGSSFVKISWREVTP